MTYLIVWSPWPHSIWVIAIWRQATINKLYRMATCVFFLTILAELQTLLNREIVSLAVTTWLCVSECYCEMRQPSKRRRFLQSSEIAELFLDTDSGNETVSSDASSVQGVPEGVPGVSHTQPYRQTDTTGSDPTMDMSLLPSEQCSTHIYRGPQRKEGQWSVPHKWRLQST